MDALSFQLPIEYINNKTKIDNHICSDLELYKTTAGTEPDNSNNLQEETTPIYNSVFLPSSNFSKKTIPLWSRYFTSDVSFLIDTQNLLKKKHGDVQATDYTGIETIWSEITTETGFHDKYQYIDWPLFKWVNYNIPVLQLVSMYNLVSPLLSLALPIFFIIIPFFLLKIKGISITFEKYKEVLVHIISKHQLGQLMNFSSVSWDKRIYIIITVGFYVLQTYQNALSCIRFYKHSKKIHGQLFEVRKYLQHTLDNMQEFENNSREMKTYQPFCDTMRKHKQSLIDYHTELIYISPYALSFKKFLDLGRIMRCFYKLYNDIPLHTSLSYSFGFNGYIENITGMQHNISTKKMTACTFTKNKTKFSKAYYPPLITSTVRNTYDINKHILLTGPNASGKTTLLKTTICNLILSQQCGIGFYAKAKIAPVDKIHCYINIPDTSSRDSLFQAEARRCKDVLDSIKTGDANHKHFCIFDELYSGTNPYEAIGGAVSFLRFLNTNKNIRFLITTHYLDMCKRLHADKDIYNCHMETKPIDNKEGKETFDYLYKLKGGISSIKGGVKVLQDLEYPDDIIVGAKKIIHSLDM
tara:strand:+ start:106 stop:1854 length:1749 start_codon:yes stop_codon:yes gene_type:complete